MQIFQYTEIMGNCCECFGKCFKKESPPPANKKKPIVFNIQSAQNVQRVQRVERPSKIETPPLIKLIKVENDESIQQLQDHNRRISVSEDTPVKGGNLAIQRTNYVEKSANSTGSSFLRPDGTPRGRIVSSSELNGKLLGDKRVRFKQEDSERAHLGNKQNMEMASTRRRLSSQGNSSYLDISFDSRRPYGLPGTVGYEDEDLNGSLTVIQLHDFSGNSGVQRWKASPNDVKNYQTNYNISRR